MKTKTTLFLAALAAITAGCSSDDAPQTPTDTNTGAPVTVNVGVGSMETRAGHSSSNLPDKFILNFDAKSVGGNTYADVTMTLDAGQYQPSVPMTWGTESRTATVRAWTEPVAVSEGTYYPTVSVAADQSTGENIRRSDFLCASTQLGNGSVTVSGDALDITFMHVFSKIDIRCHLGNELTSRYPDAKVSKVEIGGVYRGGPFNFNSATPVLAGNDYVTDQDTVTAYLNEPEAVSGDVTAEAIMIPQYFTYDLQFPDKPDERPTLTVTLIINGEEKTMQAVRITTGSFESGKRYTMTVNIGDDYVTLGEITAQPWGDGGNWGLKTE